MDFDFIVSQCVIGRVHPKQNDEGKDEKAVCIQFQRTAKIAVSEKQECSCESAAGAGDTEHVFQQAHAENFPMKGRNHE